MSSFDLDGQGIPRSSDGAPNWAADTDPVGSAPAEPAASPAGTTQPQFQREVDMSTAEFGDTLGQAPAPAPAPDGLISPMTISAAPVEPLAPPTQLAPPAPLVASPEPAALVAPLIAPPAAVELEAPAPAIPASDMKDVPLGTLIFRAGLLTEEQLEEALQDGMQRGKRLGEVLLERGLVSEGDLGRMLAGQKGLRFVELDTAVVDPTAVQLLPAEKARLHTVLPIAFHEGLPVVAVADPSNDLVVENVRRALNCEPHLVVAGREALQRQIEIAYAAPVAAPPPVAEAPVAAPTPAPAATQAVEPEPTVSAPVEPLGTAPAEPADGGVWLGVPQPAPAAPVVSFQPPELQPLVVEPVALTPAVDQPAVPQQPLPEPVAISFTPVAPADLVEQPEVVAPAPLPVVELPVAVEPLVASEPVVPLAPIVVPEPVAAPAPEPVAALEPLAARVIEPPPVPEPVAAPAAPPAGLPEPVVVAEPLAEPLPDSEQDTVVTHSVVLQLSNGDRVEVGVFRSSGEAKEHAQNVVRQISSDHGWPFFGGRFISPEAIVSVDLWEPEDRWLGSVARRRAWTASGEQPT